MEKLRESISGTELEQSFEILNKNLIEKKKISSIDLYKFCTKNIDYSLLNDNIESQINEEPKQEIAKEKVKPNKTENVNLNKEAEVVETVKVEENKTELELNAREAKKPNIEAKKKDNLGRKSGIYHYHNI